MSEYEFAESPEEINLLIKKFLELKPFDTVILNHWDESISGKHHDYSEEWSVTNIDDIQIWHGADLNMSNMPYLSLFRYDSFEDKSHYENYRYIHVQHI